MNKPLTTLITLAIGITAFVGVQDIKAKKDCFNTMDASIEHWVQDDMRTQAIKTYCKYGTPIYS
jgi:hypothetical protein